MADIGNVSFDTLETSAANYKYATTYQAGSSFTARTMVIAITDFLDDAGRVRLAIYSDSSGSPGSLLGYTQEIPGGRNGTYFAPLVSSVSITSGTYYWLAVICNGAFSLETRSSGNMEYNADTYSDGFSDPFGSSSSISEDLAILATDRVMPNCHLDTNGAIVTASDGTKVAVVTSSSPQTEVIVVKDIDGQPAIVDREDSSEINSIGWIDAAIDSNDDVHIAIAGGASGTGLDVAYCVCDLSTGFGSWEEVRAYDQGAPNNPGVAISLDGSDVPHVLFVDSVKVAGSTQDNVYYMNRSGGSWGSYTQIGTRSVKTDTYYHLDLAIHVSNAREAVYLGNTSGYGERLYYKTYISSWGSENYYSADNARMTARPSVVVQGSSATHRFWVSDTDDIYDNNSDISYDVDSASVGISTSEADDGSLRAVFYIDANDDVHLITSDVTVWTDEGALQAGTFERVIAEWAYNNENQSGELGYIYTDGTNVYYDSFSLAETPEFPPVPARVHHQRRSPLIRM